MLTERLDAQNQNFASSHQVITEQLKNLSPAKKPRNSKTAPPGMSGATAANAAAAAAAIAAANAAAAANTAATAAANPAAAANANAATAASGTMEPPPPLFLSERERQMVLMFRDSNPAQPSGAYGANGAYGGYGSYVPYPQAPPSSAAQPSIYNVNIGGTPASGPPAWPAAAAGPPGSSPAWPAYYQQPGPTR